MSCWFSFGPLLKPLKQIGIKDPPPPPPPPPHKESIYTITFSICLWLSMFKMEMYYSLHDKNSSNVVVTMMMMTMMMMTYFIYAQLKYQINNRVKKFSID